MLRSCSNMQVRAGAAHPLLQNVALNIVRLPKHLASKTAQSAALPLPVTGHTTQRSQLCELRTRASTEVNPATDKGLDDDIDDFVHDDDGFTPPPLPASAMELLSEVLTGIAASNMGNSTFSAVGMHNASGNSAGAYKPLRFCVNCCRPLSSSSSVCAGCGHNPARDAEILGDPNAWVEAYAQQLQRQQWQDEQVLLQHAQQETIGSSAASAAAAGATAPGDSFAPRTSSLSPPADVLLAADARTLLHRSSLPPYPGRPERLQAIMSRLHSAGLLERCRLLACRPATDPELLAVHSRELVAAVRGMGSHSAALAGPRDQGPQARGQPCGDFGMSSSLLGGPCSCGGAVGAPEVDATMSTPGPVQVAPSTTAPAPAAPAPHICADTLFNAHTCTAALLAAGAAADMGSALASGRARRALAVVRPPGAQAGFDVARGGCYLNNVAVAAAAALAAGMQRVMIVDWDVHHGRGTQEIFAEDPRVMVVSMHRYGTDIYPGTGAVEEVGEGEGEGTTLNVAFGGGGAGLVDGDLLSAVLHVVLPVAYQFRPQVVLVAAGFGALRGDFIGGGSCSPAVFAHLTYMLAGVAPKGLGLLLEGGYNLAATSEAVEGCLRVLLGEAPPQLPGPWGTTSQGWVAIMNAMQIHSHYWSTLHPLSFHGWTSAISNQQRQMQQRQEEEERERQAVELALQQQHEEELRQQMQQYQEREQYFGTSHLGSSFGAAGGGGWAVGALRDDDRDADDVIDEAEDGDGLSAEDLAKVALALQRAREGWELANGGSEGEPTAAALAAAELADPRDIEPAELLDLFLGSGSSGEEDRGAEGGSRSAVVTRADVDARVGEGSASGEAGNDGETGEGGRWGEWAADKTRK